MSDNDAATSLWDMVGASSGIRSFDSSAGLTESHALDVCGVPRGFPWPGWGLSTTTPVDQLKLLRLVVQPNAVLSSEERSYTLNLMENVTASEVWGVSGGVPAGVTLALKNGWLPLNATDTDWQINSIGWVSGDGGTTYWLSSRRVIPVSRTGSTPSTSCRAWSGPDSVRGSG